VRYRTPGHIFNVNTGGLHDGYRMEATMKMRTMSVLAGILGLLIPGISAAQNQAADPEATILRARAVVLTPDFSQEDITKTLIEVLDASLLILPEKDYSREFASRVEAVKKIFGEGALFTEKGRQYLGLAYKLASGGKAWQIPEALKAAYRQKDIMDEAKKACLELLDSALAERKAGRNEEAVRHLVGFVIMVVTPIEA
jgi:hypothetical protein